MREKYIAEIVKILERQDESNLLYILTFISKLFGGH